MEKEWMRGAKHCQWASEGELSSSALVRAQGQRLCRAVSLVLGKAPGAGVGGEGWERTNCKLPFTVG